VSELPENPLKFHYTNHKFEGLPWAVDKPKKSHNNRRRKARNKRNKKRLAKYHWEFDLSKKRATEYLVGFWARFNEATSKEERLEALTAASNPGWPRVSTKVKQWCRRDKGMKIAILFSQMVEVCGCCESAKAEEKHHVVPCSYGGPTIIENILYICMECHNAIHPWMEEQ